MGRPYVKWKTDDEWLYIQLGNIPFDTFTNALDSFKQKVYHKVWRSDLRAWQVPKSAMETVALFAHESFGVGTLCYWDDPQPPEQLELFG